MAYPPTRSANAELHIGLTEGKYKRAVYDRGGVVDPMTSEARKDLNDTWYGIHESNPKMSGDGVTLPTSL